MMRLSTLLLSTIVHIEYLRAMGWCHKPFVWSQIHEAEEKFIELSRLSIVTLKEVLETARSCCIVASLEFVLDR